MTRASPNLVLGYEAAAATVRSHAERVSAPRVERVGLLEAAGRVLAEPVRADRDQPPFPRSTRDGFACRAAELAQGPLRIAGLLRAGEAWTGNALGAGEAVEIMTGAAAPDGSDCVVMIEHVEVSEGRVRLTGGAPAAGENIIAAGAEARAGEVLVPAGRRIGPAEMAAAATCGLTRPVVCARPRVAILATGDELVDPAGTPRTHEIRNSNSYSLAVQVAAAGGVPEIFPAVRDDPEATAEAIARASRAGLILLTGGVSMGKFDFVEQALLAQGAEFYFTGARIQPGKPVVFGKLQTAWFFGLPGNPISTMVTFALFAAPLLRAMGGETERGPRFQLARLEGEVRAKAGLARFLPALVVSDVRGAGVQAIRWRGSADLAAAARANAFLVVPETAERLQAGDVVSVLML